MHILHILHNSTYCLCSVQDKCNIQGFEIMMAISLNGLLPLAMDTVEEVANVKVPQERFVRLVLPKPVSWKILRKKY